MIHATGQLDAIAGQPGLWADKWRSAEGTADECLFSRGFPQSVKQRQQQRHFCRLWDASMDIIGKLKFLEVGAGRCTTAQFLRSRGAEVTCLDADNAGFRLARSNFNRHGIPYPQFVLADVENIPEPNSAFDVVYSIGLLEHFSHPAAALEECCRVTALAGLNWHIIVNGNDEVYRNNYAPQYWVDVMASMGQDATCEPYEDENNVLLLKWRQR